MSPIRPPPASRLALRWGVDDRRIRTLHDDGTVDSIRIGRILRALRHRLGWRQLDVARGAGASQTLVSRAERGDIERMEIRTLRRLTTMLQAELVVMVRWRGGDLDRLLDEGHAILVGRVAKALEAAGWVVRSEVTFSVYGERGSIDIVGWYPSTATLLVVEIKTELVSVEATLRTQDVKARLASRVVDGRFRWKPRPSRAVGAAGRLDAAAAGPPPRGGAGPRLSLEVPGRRGLAPRADGRCRPAAVPGAVTYDPGSW